MTAKTEVITPVEYDRGDYANRDDIIVWHGDMVVDNVRWYRESTYTRKGYNVQYRWRGRQCKVDKYSCCLRIESSDMNYIRQQLRDLVELIEDEFLLEKLEDMRKSTDWKRDDNGRH